MGLPGGRGNEVTACLKLPTSTTPPPSKEVFFLSEMIWSPIAPVQILAIRICRMFSYFSTELEDLYLSPEIEARI